MLKICRYLFLLLASYSFHTSYSQPYSIVVSASDKPVQIKSDIYFIEDIAHNLSIDSIIKSEQFKAVPEGIPNFGIQSSVYWFRFRIRNESENSQLALKLANPALDSLEFFEPVDDKLRTVKTGISVPFSQRDYISSDYLFSFSILPHTEKYIYLRVSSNNALVLPLSIGEETTILDSDKYKDIFWGMYIGLMLAMLVYNFFVYLTTKDLSYLYYMIYVIAVIITQITLSGYAFQLLWPNSMWLAKSSTFLAPALVGITGVEFMRQFLKTKSYLPKADKVFFLFFALYAVAVVASFIKKYSIGYTLIDITASTVSIYMLCIAIIISRKGYRPAVFFLIAWIVFLLGIFIFVFKNFNILPYNRFTTYTMPVGSAMEVLLLSFALADKINILRREKEASQVQAFEALQENDRIIREQNITLEGKVNERTHELKVSNDELSKTLVELKEAQTQLVESEKMASLGQLTAGIAHEINNPINFVTSNVKPLDRDVRMLLDTVEVIEKMALDNAPITEKQKRIEEYKSNIDFDYLKEEIDQLLNGIGNGATRTAEIVKGLRIFSRLDEDDLKKADINEGLDSTLVITNNLLSNNIKIQKNYGNLPLVECYPGKLNQVFLNIISNGIYAVKKKFNSHQGGEIDITTNRDAENVYIKISDNGIGMDESTRKRLFEPFFTTKEVGEGTGLGLSISYNTINKHSGKIEVSSELGKGSEFVIILPIVHK